MVKDEWLNSGDDGNTIADHLAIKGGARAALRKSMASC